MKLIVFLTLFNAVLSEQSTNEVHGITLASIWNRNSSAIINFSRFGSIVSEKFILVEHHGIVNLANFGVAFGLYDISEVNIQNTLVPKKLIENEGFYLGLLQMQKIGCNARLACIPLNFNFDNKKLTTIGYFIDSGKIKSFDVSKVEFSECKKKFNYNDPNYVENIICLSRKQEMESYTTPLQWYNTEDRKWYVVALEWAAGTTTNLIMAFNISHFKTWIQKVVEDGTTDALC